MHNSNMTELIASSFPDDIDRLHSFYHCTESVCKYEKAKGKKQFDHRWIFKRDLTYDSSTEVWWLLFVEGQGMYCLLCRLHQAKAKQNKSDAYAGTPAVRYQIGALTDHSSGQKHIDSVNSELLRRTSIFQSKIDERTLHQRDIIRSAFTALYWLVQRGMAYHNFKSMIELLRAIGLEKMEHFQHLSMWSAREILMVMGKQIKKSLLDEVRQGKVFGLMVDDVTDISVKEQNIMFIQYVSDGEVKIKFLAVNDLLEGDSIRPDAKTITSTILKELEDSRLDVSSLMSLASDGASVMVGRKGGVATLLKKENPKMINVHCICHRLALACGDANSQLKYMATVEQLLVQLFKFLENSCVKTATYLKMQLSLRKLDLPEGQRKQQLIGRKLQRACRTRWLSTDRAVQGVWQDYSAILLTLGAEQFENDATAWGLLTKMRSIKFIGTIYILKEVLPILSNVSKCFQANQVSFARLVPAIECAKDELNKVATSLSPILKLKDDLTANGRLHIVRKDLTKCSEETDASEDEIISAFHERTLVNFLQNYVSALIRNLEDRFEQSSPVLKAFSIFDPLSVPPKGDESFHEYGNNMATTLSHHYFEEPDQQQFEAEWQKVKYDMLAWKEQRSFKDGVKVYTATEWCLGKLLQTEYRSHYPLLSFIAEVCLSCPVSNAWPERGASILKWQKSRFRARMKNDLLEAIIHIGINGPKPGTSGVASLIDACMEEWMKAKQRRKLPRKVSMIKGRPAAEPTQDTRIEEEEQEPVPSTSADHEAQCHADDIEPYIAALDLPCDSVPSRDSDSDYGSDYFSD